MDSFLPTTVMEDTHLNLTRLRFTRRKSIRIGNQLTLVPKAYTYEVTNIGGDNRYVISKDDTI